MKKLICGVVLVLAAALPSSAYAQKRPMTFTDLAAVHGVSDPQISPSGTSVLYAVTTADLSHNRRSSATYILPVAGGPVRQFPSSAVVASEARWSPDGKSVAYIADDQLWVAPVDQSAVAGSPKQLTNLSGGVSGPVWSPTGDRIAVVSAVYSDCPDDPCNAARAKADAENPVKAHVTDQLMYRHWKAWIPNTRSHLFVVGVTGSPAVDVTRGVKYDVPPGPFGGSEGYGFSPDGKEIAYTAKDQGREDAWSTDVNLYVVPSAGGTPAVITASNHGADANPVYTPDGRWILYQSQKRPGFESDAGRLMAYDRTAKVSTQLVPTWNRTSDSYVINSAGDAVFISAADASRNKIYRITRGAGGWSATPQLIVGAMNNGAPTLSHDGRSIAWVRDATDHPAEVYIASVSSSGASSIRQLTHENDALIAQLALNPAEDFWFKGANGDSVQGMLIKPAGWQAGKKYPVLLLIHGGPQGAWFDQWHGRWNASMFASTGMAIVAINPRGSTGYGQKFVDDISLDWGGKVYTDIMNGLDAALARNPWLDSTRMGAAGGSYGGYMTNWIEGHSTRFKALFTHSGPFNLEAMYSGTEEIWFPEWEYGGPFWDKNAMDKQYRVSSPHLYAANFKTPMLISHGELDYRVPYYEGVSMFTTLQRQGIPSRLIIWPDEGHWIAKPLNQKLWWSEVLGWFGKYLQ